ncbi:Eco57I restriction-modification methylase domain-containing protein [Candidatus Woesebacteria bacterium]|nr:Eco57I restriction-modification methylase domain-containing protein [Candidatus Woesebacteria bacterium]
MLNKLKKINRDSGISETFSYGVIYVYSIPDEKHKGRLKIGSATIIDTNPTQENIDSAAHDRIKQQTKTADISYILEHAELSITNDGKYFSDYDVHEVLKRSGYERKAENIKNSHSEWFEVNLDVAKNTIQAVKEGRKALSTQERNASKTSEFKFRPNQLEAIDKTTKAIKKNRKHFLWNAKMRFGKTSAAMQVAKESKMQKVLIVTHRPSVSADWYDDFKKVLASANYEYSSNTKGEKISTRIKSDQPFVYFASLQDLRLSKRVVEDESSGTQVEGFAKNEEIFDTTWDMVIVDEAHEGTQSNLGGTTLEKIPKNFTLYLSGTPFNILHKHEEEDIFTWDYVMEQDAKLHWDERNPGVPNPYAELPALSIFTYDIDTFAGHIGNLGKNFKDELDGAFKFHEFFRVHKDDEGNDTAEFIHEAMVRKFLDLLVDDNLNTKFPYATGEYRNYNKHSLWLLPNRTKVIEAMEKLLKKHSVFGAGNFGIVNISGDSRDDDEDKDAKDRVTNSIKNHEFSITLTGQRLTTGASIPEWTAVFMMSDTSSATTYLQTAFRCQTPARIGDKIKTQGYVFDFAPDRTLKLIAEAIELNHKSGKINTPEQKDAMKEFLNFCPILAAEGGTMRPYDVEAMLGQLKKAIIDRVSRNGFDDPKLYNDELLKLDELDINRFNALKALVGKSSSERVNEIKINELGMDDLKIKQAEEAEENKKKNKELTEEEKEALKKRKEALDQKKNAISILRAVSIRMPMLVYGADVSMREDITLQKFINLVDEESWQEFMPAGLTKKGFSEFTKYYDEDVFKGVAHSIRAKAFDCDNLLPTERIERIAEIFSTFKNPDKETVLTPWNVVNKHLTLAFGGHDFCSGVIDKTGKPEWKSYDVDTTLWENYDTKILEINSKSGLYPLLAAYNIYTRRLKKEKGKKSEEKISMQIWNKVLEDNIFVLCKSPMAKSITFRTLAGYKEKIKTNIIYIEDLINKLQQKDNYKDFNLKVELLERFNLKDKNMKFTAVVGNPPYQQNREGGKDLPIYPYFYDSAAMIADKYSLISPARFLFGVGATNTDWNNKMLNDEHLKVIYFKQDSSEIFPNTDIKGGIAILYRDISKNFGAIKSFTAFSELSSILQKVEHHHFECLSKLIYGVTSYTFSPKVYKDYAGIANRVGKGSGNQLTSGIFDAAPEVFLNNKHNDNQIKIYGRQSNERIYKWVNHDYINAPENLSNYKVFLPAANGSGAISEVFSTPIIGKPFVGHTATFISIGNFKKESEAEALLKYLKTKFTRAMLGIKKTTQHNKTKDVWSKVPLQDFSSKSDIGWSKSIIEIDKQLYKKYGLDKSEIDFIETHVKEMK